MVPTVRWSGRGQSWLVPNRHFTAGIFHCGYVSIELDSKINQSVASDLDRHDLMITFINRALDDFLIWARRASSALDWRFIGVFLGV